MGSGLLGSGPSKPAFGSLAVGPLLAHDPGLAIFVDDDLLTGVGQNAASPLLVEHAVIRPLILSAST